MNPSRPFRLLASVASAVLLLSCATAGPAGPTTETPSPAASEPPYIAPPMPEGEAPPPPTALGSEAPPPDDVPNVRPDESGAGPSGDEETDPSEPTPGDPPAETPPPDPVPPVLPPEEPPPPCRYPAHGEVVRSGQVMPPLFWADAKDKDGRDSAFSLEDFHCDPAFDRYNVVAFILGAGWCSACEPYFREVAGQAQAFEREGGLLVWVETEDASYNPIDSADAYDALRGWLGGTIGYRVGDGATRPLPRALYNSPDVQSFPGAFVVRRSDMRIIADQASADFSLDYPALARENGDGGPVNPDGPDPVGPAPGVCGEEVSEPNDDAGSASPMPRPEIVGGICGDDADFYRVEHPGFWSLRLDFRHADGDLDVFVWDTLRDAPAVALDGQQIGSDSASDGEAFDHFGPSVVMIYGYDGARSPYRLRVDLR